MQNMLKINCPNCGAPLDNGKCLYCGTKVRYDNEINISDIYKPTEILIKMQRGDETTLIPFMGYLKSITIENSCEYDYRVRHNMSLEIEGYPIDIEDTKW